MGPFKTIKKSRSFSVCGGDVCNATQHLDADTIQSSLSHDVKEQTTEDLHETITALRQSIVIHANANAETLEHFTTLQKAHDTLYSEHVHLQEQMDDAVELLKYLKEEKCSNENKIKELNTEIGVLKESSAGTNVGVGVVSLTIENLTKDKMELEQELQEALHNIEQYEVERKELNDIMNQYGFDNVEGEMQGGLMQKLASLHEQACRYKEQVQDLDAQSKQREGYDAKLQKLLSSLSEEKDRANESVTRLQLEKDLLMKEQKTLKSQLESIQQQEEEISRLNAKLSDSLSHVAQLQRERKYLGDGNGSPPEGHNELLLENESLKFKIKDLEDQIESYSQKDEVHAHLEKEMQERLAKRLAIQLHESKLAMEAQVRKELEEEYLAQSSSIPNKSSADAAEHEIENNLRTQLEQVKEERERWTKEQEEFQAKVLLSQQQLSQVREGYKKKLDREMTRVKELEASVSDRESVIVKLSDEYRRAMDENNELQISQSSIKQTLVQHHEMEIKELQLEINRLQKCQLGFNKLKNEMDALKQKYHDNDEELQNTLSQLEQLNVENEEYVRKLEAFESVTDSSLKSVSEFQELQAAHTELKHKYDGQKAELDTTLQQLEALNIENDEYLHKIDAFESAIVAEKKCVEQMQNTVQSLETTNTKLSLDLSHTEEERNKLEQFHLENKLLCLEMESKLKASTEETQQSQRIIKDLEAKLDILIKEREEFSAELDARKEKLLFLENHYDTAKRDKEDNISKVQDLTREIEELRSTIVTSEIAWQDRVDVKVNEIVDSHEKSVKNYEEMIDALNLEINEMKDAKSVMEGQNEENAVRIKELEEEKIKLDTMDISKAMRIEELEQEKAQLVESMKRLEEDLSLATSEKNALALDQSEKIRHLIAEKDEVASRCNMKVAALTKERDDLLDRIMTLEKEAEESKLQFVDKIGILTEHRDKLLEKIENHEKSSSEMTKSSQVLRKEQESLREMLKQRDFANQELETKLKAIQDEKDSLANDYDRKLGDLSILEQDKNDLLSEVKQLRQSGVDSRQDKQKIDQLNSELERLREANDGLTNDIATLRTPENESSASIQAEINKLKVELDTAEDRCRVLEGGLEDLQLEKEDFEAENEELASKLAELTTQAKTMLVRNEEMENQLDELSMKYDCQVSELQSQICDLNEKLKDKSSCEKDEEFEALEQKHDKALKTIETLRNYIDEAEQEQGKKQADLKRLQEETLELRQVIDHLQSENDAAREIKCIVLDLKTKNMDMHESLRTSREQMKSAAEIIERLKAENEKLTNDANVLRDSSNMQLVSYVEKDPVAEKQLVPFEAVCSDDEKKIQHYKEIVEQMITDRSISAPLKRRHSDYDGQIKLAALSYISRGDVAMLTSEAHAPFVAQGAIVPASSQAAVQMKKLTAENNDLAQRLGGAIAEKEFAMTTLTKIGEKMEELIERNKLLERIADLKSSYAIREGSVYSSSRGNSLIKSIKDQPQEGALLDRGQSQEPTSEREPSFANPSIPPTKLVCKTSQQLVDTKRDDVDQAPFYNDNSVFGDSTIVTYEASIKKPEPEQNVECQLPKDITVERRNLHAKNGIDCEDKVIVSGNPFSVHDESTCSSDVKVMKVPGGEYVGQLNGRGQKHGNGKMTYDNGNEYDGQWKNNKRDGKGTTRYSSGNVYIGMWKGGKRHGFGVFYIEKSGDSYRGNWSGGVKNGPGVYEYADGELDVSFYSDDMRVGDGVRWSKDRNKASRLFDGKLLGKEGDFPLDDAMRLTKKLGFVV